VFWTTPAFGFIALSDKFTTGSSIMPQKRNPDAAELVRAKPGRILGAFMALAVVMKGLPLAYSKDMQEDKEPAFDAGDTFKSCISVFIPMLEAITINKERIMNNLKGVFLNATDLADYLVKK